MAAARAEIVNIWNAIIPAQELGAAGLHCSVNSVKIQLKLSRTTFYTDIYFSI